VGEFSVSGKNSKAGITLSLGTSATLKGVFMDGASCELKATVNGNMPIRLYQSYNCVQGAY
jgi:hypothetical protein